MKNYYWYSIEVENEKRHEFEQYLTTIIKNLQFTPYPFTIYKATQTNGLTVNYFVSAKNEYLYSFIKNRFPNITPCSEPETNKIVEIDFYKK